VYGGLSAKLEPCATNYLEILVSLISHCSQAQWYMCVILALGKLKQEDQKMQVGQDCIAKFCQNKMEGQAPVAHTYNPCYLEGRAQEDGGSKPAWQIV
jgi:hypothetical protein